MRYDTPVYFRRILPGAYNTETGDYSADAFEETEVYASVMDTRTETMRLVYGEIRQGSKTIHLQNHYTDPFDQIRIGDKLYAVDYKRTLRVKQGFVLSEVQ